MVLCLVTGPLSVVKYWYCNSKRSLYFLDDIKLSEVNLMNRKQHSGKRDMVFGWGALWEQSENGTIKHGWN